MISFTPMRYWFILAASWHVHSGSEWAALICVASVQIWSVGCSRQYHNTAYKLVVGGFTDRELVVGKLSSKPFLNPHW